MSDINVDLASGQESDDEDGPHEGGDRGTGRRRHLFVVGETTTTAGGPDPTSARQEEQREALPDTSRRRRRSPRPSRVDVTEVGVDELVRTANGGDSGAWDELVRRYGRLVWAVTRSQGLSEADGADVYQVVWLQLVNHLGGIRDPRRVGSWLATATRYECYRTLRRRGRVTPVAFEIEGGPGLAVLDEASEDNRIDAIERSDCVEPLAAIVASLPERQRAIVTMLMLDPPPTYQEISEALGMPIGSIGPTRQRALTALRKKCEEAGLSLTEE